ncbi:MAG: hypothetical protein ACRD41_00860 [Candidatus Acidiferrales bacterium]
MLALAALCQSACTVPLSPGYRILKETREIHFLPGAQPALHISTEFLLENSGNLPLDFIDIKFPKTKDFGLENLRVQWNGQDAVPASIPSDDPARSPGVLRVPFVSAWPRGSKIKLAVDYDFRAPEDAGERITMGASSFHLGPRGWLPLPQPPHHFLSPYPVRPNPTRCTVRVPSGFLVLAGGTPAKPKQDGGEIVYRFDLRKSDAGSFVVAGRYITSTSPSKLTPVIFWTIEPLPGDVSQASARIASAWSVLQNDFGPLGKDIRGPYIIESPGLRAHIAGEEGPAAGSFPGGALVNPAALALGIDSDDFLAIVSHALAHNWFSQNLYPAPDAAIGMGEGLPEYAAIAIDEAQGGEAARRRHIEKFLREFDEAQRHATEIPLGVITPADSLAQRRISLAKAPLFFAALEDACGPASTHEGLTRLATLLRGQEAGYSDLRSALERASGKNLAEIFRVWLNQKGIPADFRARYEPGQQAAP